MAVDPFNLLSQLKLEFVLRFGIPIVWAMESVQLSSQVVLTLQNQSALFVTPRWTRSLWIGRLVCVLRILQSVWMIVVRRRYFRRFDYFIPLWGLYPSEPNRTCSSKWDRSTAYIFRNLSQRLLQAYGEHPGNKCISDRGSWRSEEAAGYHQLSTCWDCLFGTWRHQKELNNGRCEHKQAVGWTEREVDANSEL